MPNAYHIKQAYRISKFVPYFLYNFFKYIFLKLDSIQIFLIKSLSSIIFPLIFLGKSILQINISKIDIPKLLLYNFFFHLLKAFFSLQSSSIHLLVVRIERRLNSKHCFIYLKTFFFHLNSTCKYKFIYVQSIGKSLLEID